MTQAKSVKLEINRPISINPFLNEVEQDVQYQVIVPVEQSTINTNVWLVELWSIVSPDGFTEEKRREPWELFDQDDSWLHFFTIRILESSEMNMELMGDDEAASFLDMIESAE